MLQSKTPCARVALSPIPVRACSQNRIASSVRLAKNFPSYEMTITKLIGILEQGYQVTETVVRR